MHSPRFFQQLCLMGSWLWPTLQTFLIILKVPWGPGKKQLTSAYPMLLTEWLQAWHCWQQDSVFSVASPTHLQAQHR